MPFTFSHPAIVLPLACLPRRWLSLTGLIAGSLVPDFEYFLRMKMQSHYSHTLFGLFWFDLPLGLLLAFLFHYAIRDTLLDNLPSMLRSRLQRFGRIDWHRYAKENPLAVAVSILIGAVTHLFWDGFTHSYGVFVQQIPALTKEIALSGWQIPVFKLLQHGSTLIGGFAICLAVYRLPAEECGPASMGLRYWLAVSAIAFTVVAARLFSGLGHNAYGDLIATGIAATLVALALAPLMMHASSQPP